MFCPKCGKSLPEESLFCYHCGSKLPAELISETEDIPPDPQIPENIPTEPQTEEGRSEGTVYEMCEDAEARPMEAVFPVESEALLQPAKKKHPYRLPIFLMCVLFLIGLTLFYLRPFTDEPAVYQEGCFTLEDGYLFFDEKLYSGSSTLLIPETIEGHKVLGISDGCFAHNMELETVILPASLQYIGADAFFGCLNLRGIYLPDHTAYLGSRAFAKCPKLESIVIPGQITQIESGCFDGCTSLHYIFFGGNHEQWTLIYSDFISIFTYISCDDGIFQQITP